MMTKTEQQLVDMVTEATMKRAIMVIETISDADVQKTRDMLSELGVPADKLARIDRAAVAVEHLRACIRKEGGEHFETVVRALRARLQNRERPIQ